MQHTGDYRMLIEYHLIARRFKIRKHQQNEKVLILPKSRESRYRHSLVWHHKLVGFSGRLNAARGDTLDSQDTQPAMSFGGPGRDFLMSELKLPPAAPKRWQLSCWTYYHRELRRINKLKLPPVAPKMPALDGHMIRTFFNLYFIDNTSRFFQATHPHHFRMVFIFSLLFGSLFFSVENRKFLGYTKVTVNFGWCIVVLFVQIYFWICIYFNVHLSYLTQTMNAENYQNLNSTITFELIEIWSK